MNKQVFLLCIFYFQVRFKVQLLCLLGEKPFNPKKHKKKHVQKKNKSNIITSYCNAKHVYQKPEKEPNKFVNSKPICIKL